MHGLFFRIRAPARERVLVCFVGAESSISETRTDAIFAVNVQRARWCVRVRFSRSEHQTS